MAEQKNDATGNSPVDKVLAVSRHADGSPAQTPGFKSVDPEATALISEAQLREQAASAVDHEKRQADAEVSDPGEGEPDPETKKLKKAQEAAADAAAKKVENLG